MHSLKSWLGNFRATVGDRPVMILANKSDLEKKYSFAELETFSASVGCEAVETSAKTGLNVENAFLRMGKKLVEGAK